jgi:hypothetical protein
MTNLSWANHHPTVTENTPNWKRGWVGTWVRQRKKDHLSRWIANVGIRRMGCWILTSSWLKAASSPSALLNLRTTRPATVKSRSNQVCHNPPPYVETPTSKNPAFVTCTNHNTQDHISMRLQRKKKLHINSLKITTIISSTETPNTKTMTMSAVITITLYEHNITQKVSDHHEDTQFMICH